jgi:hypothetical protein
LSSTSSGEYLSRTSGRSPVRIPAPTPTRMSILQHLLSRL